MRKAPRLNTPASVFTQAVKHGLHVREMTTHADGSTEYKFGLAEPEPTESDEALVGAEADAHISKAIAAMKESGKPKQHGS